MRIIQKADIVGARIVEVHETYELKDGLDEVVIYFTMDRGFAVQTPTAEFPWTTVDPPVDARRLEDKYGQGLIDRILGRPSKSTILDDLKEMRQKVIAGVSCEPRDPNRGFYYPSDGIIVFDDGSRVSNTMVAPYGTGGAGLYFSKASDPRLTPLDKLVDYFTIPLRK